MKRLIHGLLTLLLVAGLAAAIYYLTLPSWPEFPVTTDNKPQSKVVVADRDYGYRIGDVIPVELVIRQQPGTRVQLSTLTIAGDFEMHEKPTVQMREHEDGSALYRVCFRLQSFETSARLSFKAQVSWEDLKEGKGATYDVPETKIGYSMTWDGRKELQEGRDTRSAIWYWVRAVVPLTFGVLLYLYLIQRSLRQWLKTRRQLTPEQMLQKRYAELLDSVSKGAATSEHYRELESIIREHWQLQSVPVTELKHKLRRDPAWRDAVHDFLAATAAGIYPETPISDEDRAVVVRTGESLRHPLRSPRPEPAPDKDEPALDLNPFAQDAPRPDETTTEGNGAAAETAPADNQDDAAARTGPASQPPPADDTPPASKNPG